MAAESPGAPRHAEFRNVLRAVEECREALLTPDVATVQRQAVVLQALLGRVTAADLAAAPGELPVLRQQIAAAGRLLDNAMQLRSGWLAQAIHDPELERQPAPRMICCQA